MCDCKPVKVIVQAPKKNIVQVKEVVCLPIVKVLVPGIQGPEGPQGPPGSNEPLDVNPLETYLKARGEINGSNS